MFIRYKNMKDNVKCTNLGGLGSPNVTGSVNIRWSTYNFQLDFNRNYASVLYRFWVVTSYLLKVSAGVRD